MSKGQDNSEQLQKITSLFNYQKILTKDDVDEVIGALVKILAKNKSSYEEATKGHQQNNDGLFQKVVDHTNNHSQDINSQLQTHLETIQQIAKEVKNTLPKDGIDGEKGEDGISPDPDDLVEAVLAKIKLPEQKEQILDPNDLVAKISALPPKKRLHIKNLDGVIELQDLIARHAVEAARGLLYAGLVDGSKTTTSSSGTGGYTVETPSGTVDENNTTFTVTVVPVYIVSDGITYFNKNGFTISGLTLTLSIPPTSYIRSFHV